MTMIMIRLLTSRSTSPVLGIENIEYEPEQFPAIVHRPPQFAVTLLIFSTGKAIVGGTTDREEAKSAPSST
jgi:transcription initiation factor TFIID TATA-box-binding protein